MNIVLEHGRLTRDPEINTTASGLTVARFTIAVDRLTKDKGADFINIKAFGKSAEFAAKFFEKGKEIIVEGHIQTGSYEKDGKKIYTTDIIADRFEFCGSKEVNEKAAGEVPF